MRDQNMRRLLLVSLATIPLTGCQLFNREDTALIDPIDSAVIEENIASAKLEGDEAFADPTVEPENKGGGATDLIRSTDSAARTRQVERNRIDPFASLPIPPAPEVVVSPVAAAGNGGGVASGGASGGTSRGSVAGSGANAATAASTAAAKPTPPPKRVEPVSTPLVLPSPIATLPTIPQPVIAPTVSISGVIQLGNEPYAIVRSGSEPERYVKVGDRIAGGSVRVKRIETLAFEPRVILEENGIEVSRPVGGEAEEAEAKVDTPVAVVPMSSAFDARQPRTGQTRAGQTQPFLPTIPSLSPLPTPNSSQPMQRSNVPNSLLLQSAETTNQAVLPNFRIATPELPG
ncbi:MAG: hypothetical protein WA885_23395 [Phormidesmis sp.]